MRKGGVAKIMPPAALVGMLLAMGSGAKSTPKGGLTELLDAALRGDLQPEASGKFGEGAYKEEPWSIVAMRKRIYAIRSFYEFHLKDAHHTKEMHPGWNEEVTGTLNSFALLLGTKPQHVPKVRAMEAGSVSMRACAARSARARSWVRLLTSVGT